MQTSTTPDEYVTPEQLLENWRTTLQLPTSKNKHFFISYQLAKHLQRAANLFEDPSDISPTHLKLFGIRLTIKPNQQRPYWIIHHPSTAKAYDAGDFTEDVLILATQSR